MRRSATSASGSSLRISRTTALIAQKVARDFLRPCPPNKVIITLRTCRREPPHGPPDPGTGVDLRRLVTGCPARRGKSVRNTSTTGGSGHGARCGRLLPRRRSHAPPRQASPRGAAPPAVCHGAPRTRWSPAPVAARQPHVGSRRRATVLAGSRRPGQEEGRRTPWRSVLPVQRRDVPRYRRARRPGVRLSSDAAWRPYSPFTPGFATLHLPHLPGHARVPYCSLTFGRWPSIDHTSWRSSPIRPATTVRTAATRELRRRVRSGRRLS